MTGVEAAMWVRLRRRQVSGHKFRRQAPIGPYIVDFVCLQAKLIVEIDGPHHDFTSTYDARRQTWLESAGFRVMRFAPADVSYRMTETVEAVAAVLTELNPSGACRRHLPAKRGGA